MAPFRLFPALYDVFAEPIPKDGFSVDENTMYDCALEVSAADRIQVSVASMTVRSKDLMVKTQSWNSIEWNELRFNFTPKARQAKRGFTAMEAKELLEQLKQMTSFVEHALAVLDEIDKVSAAPKDVADLKHNAKLLRRVCSYNSYRPTSSPSKPYAAPAPIQLGEPRIESVQLGLDPRACVSMKEKIYVTRGGTALKSPAFVERVEGVLKQNDILVKDQLTSFGRHQAA